MIAGIFIRFEFEGKLKEELEETMEDLLKILKKKERTYLFGFCVVVSPEFSFGFIDFTTGNLER